MYGLNEEVGDVTLIQNKNGNVTGTIDLEGTFYEIRPLGKSGMHMVRQVDTEYMKDLDRGNDVAIGKNKKVGSTQINSLPEYQFGSSNSTLAGARCSPEYQRILVLYTQAANQLPGDINGIIALSIQEANESYSNSQVNNMRIALAHSQQINFNEGYNIVEDLDALVNNANVQNLRNQHNADAVILLTNGNYGNIAGRADAILATSNTAYAIVEVEFAGGPDYTFAHELGHLQGAQHHPNDPVDPNGPFSFGFGHRFSYKASFFVPRRYRSTIMAYPCRPFSEDPTCNRVYSGRKYFSNPNVEYRGTDTGILGERENYRVLRNTAALIADFRNPNELRASVSSMPDGSTSRFQFTANPCGGTGNYTYEWRISYDSPFYFGSVISTAQSFTWTFPEGQHYVQATVRSGTNQESQATAFVYVSGTCFGRDCPILGATAPKIVSDDNPQIPDKLQLYPAYPNPFNPATQISFNLPQPQAVNLRVYDMAGREVAVLADGRKAAGTHRFSFGEAGLASGVYFVRLQVGSDIQTQKITLLK